MLIGALFGVLVLLAVGGYVLGQGRALALGAGGAHAGLHSRPNYHGLYVAMWTAMPGLLVLFLWVAFHPHTQDVMIRSSVPHEVAAQGEDSLRLFISQTKSYINGQFGSVETDSRIKDVGDMVAERIRLWTIGLSCLVLAMAAAGILFSKRSIQKDFRARNKVESATMILLMASSSLSILITIGIVFSLLFEAVRFFSHVSVWDFLFGVNWSPQMALRADQVGSSGEFGALPLFAGTLMITLLSMLVAAPVGLMAAVYMSEYATPGVRALAKPVLEILAGIPTVVYGFFAALTVAPLIRDAGVAMGLDVASESALAAGLVMGIMIIPFVSSLSDDVINAVPQSLRDGSYGLGATRSETIRLVILPAALPGIVGALLLAVARAVGETMIVVMAAGLSANLTANPLEAMTTVTVQIVTLLVGDQEFDSPKTLAAFALGLALFVVTLGLNMVAQHVVRKYKEQYE
ncbi:MAG: phosphate ABC transporter permease subunit PstC [Magnetococcus sp. WYHC-3]